MIGRAAGEAAKASMQDALDAFSCRIGRLEEALMQNRDEVWTTERAAEFLECEPATVLKYVREDGLEGVRRGKRYYFKRSNVLAFVTSASAGRLAKRLQSIRKDLYP